MTRKQMLLGTSLFSVVLLSLHLTQDALQARPGTRDAGTGNFVVILILVVLLVGTALLAERRAGHIIMLLGAVFALAMPVLHFTGRADWSRYGAPFLFVWCLLALGVSGSFTLILLTTELPRVWHLARRD